MSRNSTLVVARSSQMRASAAFQGEPAPPSLANSYLNPADETAKGNGAESVKTLWDSSALPNVIINTGGVPAAASSPAPHAQCPLMRSMIRLVEAMCAVTLIAGGMAGMSTAVARMESAGKSGDKVSAKQLSMVVAQVVSCTMAGTLTGAVMGPIQAVRLIGGIAVRPLVAAVLVRRTVRWANGRCRGATESVKKLQSGDISQQLIAVRQVLSQASRGEKFRIEFDSLGGIQQLLKILQDAVAQLQAGTPLLLVILKALEALMKSNECKDSFVAAGGVPVMVSLLKGGRSIYCSAEGAGNMTTLVPVEAVLAVLAHVSDNSLAQDAMREAGALPALLELASAGKYDSGTSLQSVKLLQSLALDPVNKGLIGQAGGVRTILNVIQSAPVKSELQTEAVVCLHNVLRGNYDNQGALAREPGSALALGAAMKSMGAVWHPCKPDLHALLNLLARFPSEACHSASAASRFDVPPSSPAAPASAMFMSTPPGAASALSSSALTWTIPPSPSMMGASTTSASLRVGGAPMQASAALTSSLLSASLMSAHSQARSSLMSSSIPPACPPAVYTPTSIGTPPARPPMSPNFVAATTPALPPILDASGHSAWASVGPEAFGAASQMTEGGGAKHTRDATPEGMMASTGSDGFVGV